MKRREFLASLAGAASAPFGAAAQQRKLPRIGVLWPGANADAEHIRLEALRESLKGVGLVHGETILLENRFAKQQPDEFRRHSEELASLNVAVLVAITQPAALAAQRATKTLPIVFLLAPDPVGTGLVDSLAMPGGNITGLSTMAVEYIGQGSRLAAARACLLLASMTAIRLSGLFGGFADLFHEAKRPRTLGLSVDVRT